MSLTADVVGRAGRKIDVADGVRSRATMIARAEAQAAAARADATLLDDLRTAGARSDWRADALCRDADPELFYPVGEGVTAALQVRHAKAVCHGCPVRTSCLRWALDAGEGFGVWGGLSPEERRSLARRRG